MNDDWEMLALFAGVTTYAAHHWLHSSLHEQIPLTGETASVGAGLAVLAAVGVGINSWYYSQNKG